MIMSRITSRMIFWRKLYADPTYPVPDISTFIDQLDKDVQILPHVIRRQPGRQKTKIFPSVGEGGKKRCKRCGDYKKHNWKACTAPV